MITIAVFLLTSTTQTIFTKKLALWHEKYKDFLAEKTMNPDTLKESFTHQKLVSAYKSLRTNLPYLFTYKNHKEFKIHNTTNAIDGGVFSPMTRCPLRVKSYLKYIMDLVKV